MIEYNTNKNIIEIHVLVRMMKKQIGHFKKLQVTSIGLKKSMIYILRHSKQSEQNESLRS